MDIDKVDYDYEEGSTSSDDEGMEMDRNGVTAGDEKQRDYKVR
jgi:hypothetical protein